MLDHRHRRRDQFLFQVACHLVFSTIYVLRVVEINVMDIMIYAIHVIGDGKAVARHSALPVAVITSLAVMIFVGLATVLGILLH